MKNLWISIKITLAMCVVLFVGYVLVLRLVAWVASPNDGEAPVVTYNGKVVGAANVGQVFTDSVYFWGRPSNVDYNGGGSGGSNKGTNNPEYLAQVEERFKHKSRIMEILAEFEDAAALNAFLVEITARQYQVLSFETVDPGKQEAKGEEKKGVAANVTMWVPAHKDHEDILLELERCPGLCMIEEL